MKQSTGSLNQVLSRRTLMRGAAISLTGAGASLLFGCGEGQKPSIEDLDGPPETTRVRLIQDYGTCSVPMLMARDFLPEEGLPDFEYIAVRAPDVNAAVTEGRVDLTSNYAAAVVASVSRGSDLVVLAGMHGGCIEIFAREGVNSLADLRGKTVAMGKQSIAGSDAAFLTSILRYIGINDQVRFQERTVNELLTAIPKGEVDAVVALPPLNLQLRDAGDSRVILNSMMDSPWSQQFCCMVIANRAFVRDHPRATKRALRAVIRGEEVCVQDPERAARVMYERGGAGTPAYALEIVRSIPYGAWRTFSPDDALRFTALRMREAGEIRLNPDDVVRRCSDWRFLDQLKREMPRAALPRTNPASPFECRIPA